MPVIMVPHNYPDIQSAVNAALPGDEIHVGNGVYKEQVTIKSKNNISIDAKGKSVTIDGCGFTPPTIALNLVKSADIKIMGFNIKGFDKGIIVDGLSKGITIADNMIKDIRDDGVKIKGDNCIVTNNLISKCKDDALKILSGNCIIKNNYICDNKEEGIEINGDGNTLTQNTVRNNSGIGIEITGNGNTAMNNTVENSGISDITDSGTGNTVVNGNR